MEVTIKKYGVLPKKLQFATKTAQNIVFLAHKAQISNQLHIMVMYISLMGFKKFQISAQNRNGLAFSFTKKRQFVTKNDRNSVFYDHKAQILNWLHIMVMYISFYGF
jgi:hypothetical protein